MRLRKATVPALVAFVAGLDYSGMIMDHGGCHILACCGHPGEEMMAPACPRMGG